jgi:hypothetical protein
MGRDTVGGTSLDRTPAGLKVWPYTLIATNKHNKIVIGILKRFILGLLEIGLACWSERKEPSLVAPIGKVKRWVSGRARLRSELEGLAQGF